MAIQSCSSIPTKSVPRIVRKRLQTGRGKGTIASPLCIKDTYHFLGLVKVLDIVTSRDSKPSSSLSNNRHGDFCVVENRYFHTKQNHVYIEPTEVIATSSTTFESTAVARILLEAEIGHGLGVTETLSVFSVLYVSKQLTTILSNGNSALLFRLLLFTRIVGRLGKRTERASVSVLLGSKQAQRSYVVYLAT